MSALSKTLNPEVADTIIDLLKDEKVVFTLNANKDHILAEISEKDFNRILDLALCIRQQGEDKTPVFSLNMLREMWKKGIKPIHYSLLERDVPRFMLEGGIDGCYGME